ncbi:Lrp/AsnC family transcriptional regulator [Chitinophaga caseinilytica]|uniref:Lrp/AsnC family transcriptional regulator n=1 Tax=Chitinophaga caseinilytica TaxID=2267521 RepID=A0ABZ2YX67_9BACT
MQLDKTDLRLLTLLQHDARLSNKELADKLGKSVTPVLLRRKKLEESGYIKKYMAIVDRHLINRSLMAFTSVQLKEHAEELLHAFQQSVSRFEEVMSCHHMTGTYDYHLKIVVADMNAYHKFITEKLAKLPNVLTVQSSFVMAEVKDELAYTL